MGYLKNHLATVVTAAFAAVLTALWPWFVNTLELAILNFVFIMAVPITWFLALMCWLAQKSADYAHSMPHEAVQVVATTVKTSVTQTELQTVKDELSGELDTLRDTIKIKDTEIERLKDEISNLETRVQIESLRSELANLKALASR